MLATSLLVIHDTSRGGQDDVAELTRRKELGSPLLEVTELNGVAGIDDTALVETGELSVCSNQTLPTERNVPAVQLDDNLAGTVVIDLLEFANVAYQNECQYVAKN